MKIHRLIIVTMLLVAMTGACKQAPVSNILERSTPEAQGVSSRGIIDFLDAATKSSHEFHSFVFLRHGKVIAEGWWDPYKADLKHTLYSTSKSFTATAVGLAVAEKKLTVNDKVISFFPDELPDTVSPFLSDMKVKDLLSMSAGQDPDPTFTVTLNSDNWVRSFLALPVVNKPGSKFLYNTLATYMLSAIVQKVTGEKIIDYLTPRLFQPLGIEGMDWETDPAGINTGGWGLRLKTEDMARFGQLFLQNGKWNGKQVLPAAWIKEATTAWIDQVPDASREKKDSSDWMQGYCYQMWRCRHNAFRGDGAYGQFIIVMPDQDAVIAITAETMDMQGEIDLIWQYLLPAMNKDKLPENSQLAADLDQRLSSLKISPPEKTENPQTTEISGKTFAMDENSRKIKSLSFHMMDNMCHLTLKMEDLDYSFAFGAGEWIPGETTMIGPNLISSDKVKFTGAMPIRIAGSFRWRDANTLELILRYIESPHTQTMICKFDRKKLDADIINSNNPGDSFSIKGKMKD